MFSPSLVRWVFRLTVLVATAAPGVSASDEPLVGVDDRWTYVQSPNFELYTHGAEREGKATLRDLELLRALFLGREKLKERAKLDVAVFVFRRRAEFTAYAGPDMAQREVGGFYLAGPDRAVISLAPTDNDDQAQRLIFHEYIHHLFRITEQEPPLWFNEGMAELFAAIREENGKLEVGQPHIGRIATLATEKLLPLETLFAVDHTSPIYRTKDHAGLFYAQSWALLHYWHFGESGLPKDGVARFTRVAGNPKLVPGIDLRAFFRECFAMDYPDMQRRLERYVSGGSYRPGRLPMPEVPAATAYRARAVPKEEIRLRLAELALRTTRSAAGKFLLVEAAARPAVEPRVLEALGADAWQSGDEQVARGHWERALSAGSTNAAVLRELGLLESRDWFKEFNYDFRLPVETAQRLRQRLRAAIEREPEQTAPYEMLAWVEAFSDAPEIANVNLVQGAFGRLRQKQRVLLALVVVRLRAKLTEQATAMLADFDKLEFDGWAAQGAETVRARLEGRPARQITAPDPNAIRVNAAASGKRLPPLRTPSIELP